MIGALVLGIIEPLAHIVAGRANPKTRIYSPGMVTSLLFMLPLDAFTIWHVVAVEPFAWCWWLAATALLLIPLFGTQRLIVVKMMGMSYGSSCVTRAIRFWGGGSSGIDAQVGGQRRDLCFCKHRRGSH